MEAYEYIKYETVRNLTVLVRHAVLHRRAHKVASLTNIKASVAIERVLAYASECLAFEVHKQRDKPQPIFVPEIQAQFAAIGEIIDRHLTPGLDEIERRRSLLRRAHTFCHWLPHLEEQSDSIDYEAVADALNEREARRELYKFLFRRDTGEFGPMPTYSGGMDEDFTAAEAFKFIVSLDRLHQLLDERIRLSGPIFVNRDSDAKLIDGARLNFETGRANKFRLVGGDQASHHPADLQANQLA